MVCDCQKFEKHWFSVCFIQTETLIDQVNHADKGTCSLIECRVKGLVDAFQTIADSLSRAFD